MISLELLSDVSKSESGCLSIWMIYDEDLISFWYRIFLWPVATAIIIDNFEKEVTEEEQTNNLKIEQYTFENQSA